MGMNNSYEKAWEAIREALTVQSKMVLWIAERTLSAKDFKEFVDEFAKPSKEEDISMSEIIGVGETCAE